MAKACSLSSQSTEESAELIDNGLILNDTLVPVELIQRILCYVDAKTLLRCQLVCKRWNEIIVDYVWRKKAEIITGCKIPMDSVLKSSDFFAISANRLFNRNFIKNHSGEESFKHWQITHNKGNRWAIECPPIGAPSLPPEPEFENKQHCFVTSFGECCKNYLVDLIKEGFTVTVLDNLRPSIEISEWYSCRWDCPAVYTLRVYLLNEFEGTIDEFFFEDILTGDRQNCWFNVKHVFKNDGQGVRKIRFVHRGRDRRFWAGHYGSKMAGACVKVNIPDDFKKFN